jgi:zeta-carotene isomerase
VLRPAATPRLAIPTAFTSPSEEPEIDLPTPTEEGGPLAKVLPLSLLLESQEADRSNDLMVGEDAGRFAWRNEEWGAVAILPATETGAATGAEPVAGRGWLQFTAAVGTILTALAVLWIYSPTGYGDDFVAALEALCGGNSHLVTLSFGVLFPLVHSGLAALRPWARQYTGERLWRVIFASFSLPLAYSWIVYYVGHVHDGYTFWDLQASPAAHGVAWTINFASFFFLYPTVFNLKEVAAVERPRMHLWETGIIRVSRHPQAVGQVMWSAAHLAMVGSTFCLLTNALLVGHHLFACWHGDRRLLEEHGEDFLAVKARTSTVPFQAILQGRQVLPPDYYKELVRAPYALIAAGTLAAYLAHPYMQAGAALVRNTGLVPGGCLDGLFQ